MPKFRVTATEVIFYRTIVEAETASDIEYMDTEDMDFEEYDSEGMLIQTVELVKKT